MTQWTRPAAIARTAARASAKADGVCGRVDANVEILTFIDRLEMSGNGLYGFQTGDDDIWINLEGPCKCRRSQGGRCRPGTDQW